MNLSPSTHPPLVHRAFTLIELLVVITIIAVLAGLLLPVTQKVLENSRKVSAKTTQTQIISAVNSFQVEYGQYPVPANTNANTTSTSAAKDTSYGLNGDNHNQPLFDILRNLEPTGNTAIANSRHIVYFESKNVKSATNPRDGFILTGMPKGNPKASPVVTLAVGDLVDPWGNMYCVRIDTNYTNIVVNPYSKGTPTTDDTDDPLNPPLSTDAKYLHTAVLAWSYGNDGIPGSAGITLRTPYSPTPGDDVDSWQ